MLKKRKNKNTRVEYEIRRRTAPEIRLVRTAARNAPRIASRNNAPEQISAPGQGFVFSVGMTLIELQEDGPEPHQEA